MNLLNANELFVMSATEGSFSAVARLSGLAPSSVSRQIDALEERLGVRLLQRSTRKISLTEAGQLYFDRVSRVLWDLADIENEISDLQGRPQGILRLNLPVPFGERIVVPLLAEFLATYPDISIEMTLEDKPVDLIDKQVDLAIRIGKLQDSTLVARKLADNPFVVCATPAYLDQYGEPLNPNDISRHICLSNFNIPNCTEWTFSRGEESVTVQVRSQLRANTGGAVYAAMQANLGLGALPLWYVSSDIASGELRQILPDYQFRLAAMEGSAIHAIFSESRYLPSKVRVFVDYLVSMLGSDKRSIV